jgi:hypothetical protein
MPKCCNVCFNDSGLKQKIRTGSQEYRDGCDFCTGQSESFIDCSELKYEFEFLIDTLFLKSDCLESLDLSELLQNKLSVFTNHVVRSKELLISIVENPDIYDGLTRYLPRPQKLKYSDNWLELQKELVEQNRFFPKNDLFTSLFRKESNENTVFIELASQLTMNVPLGSTFFRARIADNILDDAQMGKPPRDLASDGRANPNGIPYLYTSEALQTCIAEVRPSVGGTICIAEICSIQKLRVIDLTAPRIKFSPTSFEDKELVIALSLVDMLEQLSIDLSKPLANARKLNYLPTQFFCEFIKSLNFVNGVKFSSSFDSKNNIVFFEPIDEQYFEVTSKKLILVKSTQHTIDEVED